jgi:C-terminal processing protease CtpA/Prc
VHALAIALLLGGLAWAQSQPDAPKKDQAPPNPPQPSTQKADEPAANQQQTQQQTEQPRQQAQQPREGQQPRDAAPRRDQTNQRQDRAGQRQDQAAPRRDQTSPGRDQSTTRRDQSSQESPDRADRSRQQQPRETPDAARNRNQRDTAREPARTDRDRTGRDTRDAEAGRRDTDRAGQQDRTAESRRGQKQLKASDLGFSFSEEKSEKGLKISKVSSQTVASKAAFKEGDVIISVNDHDVTSQSDFFHWIHAAPDERIVVVVLRDDREVPLYLEPDILFQETTVSQGGAWLGVDLYDRFTRAAVVLKVHPGSPAQRAGLRGDDLIVSVNGQEITSPEHLGQVIGQMRPGDQVEIEVERNRRSQLVDATLASRQSVTQRTEVVPGRTIFPRR